MHHQMKSANQSMPFRPFGRAHDLRLFDKAHDFQQAQGPDLAEGQPTHYFVVTTETMRTLILKVLGG